MDSSLFRTSVTPSNSSLLNSQPPLGENVFAGNYPQSQPSTYFQGERKINTFDLAPENNFYKRPALAPMASYGYSNSAAPVSYPRAPASPPSSTLFIGDLPVLATEEALFDLFHVYGSIESIQLKKNEYDMNKNHLNYGFIKFFHPESAARALEDTNGKVFLGRQLRVGWAEDYPKRTNSVDPKFPFGRPASSGPRPTRSLTATAQVHVTFITRDLGMPVNELTLRNVFVRFGNLMDVVVKKSVVNHDLGIHSGYGFVHYPMNDDGIRSALMAIDQLNHNTVNNVSFECTMSHGLKTYMLSLTHNARTRLNLPADRIFAMLGSDHGNSVVNNAVSQPIETRLPVTAFPKQVSTLVHSNQQMSESFTYGGGSKSPFPRPQTDTLNQFSLEIISPRTSASVTPSGMYGFDSSRSGSNSDTGSQLFSSYH